MKTSIPERISAAVEQLAVQPHEQILEIGCGNGAAVSLVCDKLDGGRLVAIDRSETQIQLASRRNHAHLQSGKLILHTMALEAVTLDEAQFDKIFAINVNCFWLRYEQPLATVKRLLKPHGAFFISSIPFAVPGSRFSLSTQRSSFPVLRATLSHNQPASLPAPRQAALPPTSETPGGPSPAR